MASRTSSMDWVIQMTGNCCGSQTQLQITLNQTSSQQTQSQTQSHPTHSQNQSERTQNENGEIRVSWITPDSSHDFRRSLDPVFTNTAIRTKYEEAVKGVENKARVIYKDDNFNPVPGNGDDFVRIMVDQGCFILLVALRSLGFLKNLNLNWKEKEIRTLVLDLFSFRKQLPLVVLQVLMKEAFFQDAVKSAKRRKQPNDLPRKVFYDHLVEPILDSPDRQVNIMKRLLSSVSSRGSLSHQEPSPPTLLHAVWVLLTGPASGGADDKRFLSCVNRRGHSHQEPSPPALLHALWEFLSGGADDNSSNNVSDDEYENDNEWSTVRSATELKEKIVFKSNKEKGTRGIKFEENMLDADLYLPPITIESDTEKLFKHLIDYEEDIGFNKNQREVCSYLKLMSELVRTTDDARILAMHGIINAHPKQEANLFKMLEELKLPEVLGNDDNLQNVRRKIRSYVKPSKWKMVRDLIVIGLVISFFSLLATQLQTSYTIFAYYHPPSGSSNKN